jgi:mitochondrial fission protein ELM1
MTEARQTAQHDTDPAMPEADRIWVLDDPRAGTSAQAIGIAERLGVPFRRIPLAWNWMAHMAGLPRGGSLIGLSANARALVGAPIPGLSLPGVPPFDPALPDPPLPHPPPTGPALVISAGRRSGAVALWLKARYGCRLVHCMSPGLAGLLRADAFDMLVVPEHDRAPPSEHVFPILGAPHRISPLLLAQAQASWQERLAHMPRPRVAMLVGGAVRGLAMPPVLAHGLARHTARLVARRGGSVLATTSRRTGEEATQALASGLSSVLHLLYRWGEPDENPYLGFLASADAIIVTADSVAMISEACATGAAVYIALPELAGARHRRLLATLYQAGQARRLTDELTAWQRPTLDEAARIAAEIRRRFPLE